RPPHERRQHQRSPAKDRARRRQHRGDLVQHDGDVDAAGRGVPLLDDAERPEHPASARGRSAATPTRPVASGGRRRYSTGMRRAAWICVLVVALLSITATPSLAWRRAWSGGGHGGGQASGGSWHGGHGHVHGRVVVGVSPWWGWGWGWPYYPYGGYYGPPYAYYPSTYPAHVVTQAQ